MKPRSPNGLNLAKFHMLVLVLTLAIAFRGFSQPFTFTTIGGKAGVRGIADGDQATSRFFNPSGICVDSSGRVYVSDTGNYTIRQLTRSNGMWFTRTLAG